MNTAIEQLKSGLTSIAKIALTPSLENVESSEAVSKRVEGQNLITNTPQTDLVDRTATSPCAIHSNNTELNFLELLDPCKLIQATNRGEIHLVQYKIVLKPVPNSSGPVYGRYNIKNLIDFLETDQTCTIYSPESSFPGCNITKIFECITSITLYELAQDTHDHAISIEKFKLLKQLGNLANISLYKTTANQVNICDMPQLRKLDLGIIEPGKVNIVNCETSESGKTTWSFDPTLSPELVIEYSTRSEAKCEKLDGYIKQIKALQTKTTDSATQKPLQVTETTTTTTTTTSLSTPSEMPLNSIEPVPTIASLPASKMRYLKYVIPVLILLLSGYLAALTSLFSEIESEGSITDIK